MLVYLVKRIADFVSYTNAKLFLLLEYYRSRVSVHESIFQLYVSLWLLSKWHKPLVYVSKRDRRNKHKRPTWTGEWKPRNAQVCLTIATSWIVGLVNTLSTQGQRARSSTLGRYRRTRGICEQPWRSRNIPKYRYVQPALRAPVTQHRNSCSCWLEQDGGTARVVSTTLLMQLALRLTLLLPYLASGCIRKSPSMSVLSELYVAMCY